MTVTLEARKIRLRDLLAEIEDESIILQIEQFLRRTLDFLDELSPEEQSDIEEASGEADRGEGVEATVVMSQLRQRNR